MEFVLQKQQTFSYKPNHQKKKAGGKKYGKTL